MTRMPDGLHTRLRKEAKLNARSVNAEIIHRLASTFAKADEESEFQRLVDAVGKVAARTVAAVRGPAVLAKLEKEIAVEREIFESAFSEPSAPRAASDP
jgi:hypothetical protein